MEMKRKRVVFLAVVILLAALRIAASFGYFIHTEGDDKTWYFLGDRTLRAYGLEDPMSDEMKGFYARYYSDEIFRKVSYMPVLWYFMALLVKASGSSYRVFDALFVIILNVADVIAFVFLYKILRSKRVSENAAFALAVAYFMNPVTLNSLKWRQMNGISVMFLVLSVHLYSRRKEVKSSLAFGFSYISKLIAAYLIPVFLIKAARNRKALFSIFAVPLIGSAAYIASSRFDFGGNLAFGSGISPGDPWNLSFSGLLALFGIGSPAVSYAFLCATFLFLLLSYFVFRKESMESLVFVVMSVYFLFANLIEIHHIVFLYAAVIMNWDKHPFIRKMFPLYLLVPLGWFLGTPDGFGTRMLSAFGITWTHFIEAKAFTIIAFKAVIVLGLLPYIRGIDRNALIGDIKGALSVIRRCIALRASL